MQAHASTQILRAENRLSETSSPLQHLAHHFKPIHMQAKPTKASVAGLGKHKDSHSWECMLIAIHPEACKRFWSIVPAFFVMPFSCCTCGSSFKVLCLFCIMKHLILETMSSTHHGSVQSEVRTSLRVHSELPLRLQLLESTSCLCLARVRLSS